MHFVLLDRMNSVFFFSKYKFFSSFLAAGFCRKNLAFARKNNGFARVWGGGGGMQPSEPLACVPMSYQTVNLPEISNHY